MFDGPSFLIQLGWQGHKLAENLLSEGHASGVILSPSDYPRADADDLAETFGRYGDVLFDPQFYLPRSTRDQLHTYSYFQEQGGEAFDTDDFETGPLINNLIQLQDYLGVEAHIAPARLMETLSTAEIESWYDLVDDYVSTLSDEGMDAPVFASLPVHERPLNDRSQRDELLNYATQLDLEGFYVSPFVEGDNRYPLTGVSRLYSILDTIQSLKRNQYSVLMGHSHHVAHLYFAVGADAFASGHHKNLKAFDKRRWEDDEGGWAPQVFNYYSEEVLGDLRVEQDLDLLYQTNELDRIKMDSPFNGALYSGGVPSEAGWTNRHGEWDHSLWAYFQIAAEYGEVPEDARMNHALQRIEEAREAFNALQEEGIMLSQIDESLYEDWERALKAVRGGR